MELLALLSRGKGTCAQVSGLMTHGDCEHIILLGDEFSKQFKHDKEFEFVKIDLDKKIKDKKIHITVILHIGATPFIHFM